jgi:hypothetical protein
VERLRVRRRRGVLPAARELEVRVRSGDSEEDPVVTPVVFEATDLLETETVPSARKPRPTTD